jgi:hypothetical protein
MKLGDTFMQSSSIGVQACLLTQRQTARNFNNLEIYIFKYNIKTQIKDAFFITLTGRSATNIS